MSAVMNNSRKRKSVGAGGGFSPAVKKNNSPAAITPKKSNNAKQNTPQKTPVNANNKQMKNKTPISLTPMPKFAGIMKKGGPAKPQQNGKGAPNKKGGPAAKVAAKKGPGGAKFVPSPFDDDDDEEDDDDEDESDIEMEGEDEEDSDEGEESDVDDEEEDDDDDEEEEEDDDDEEAPQVAPIVKQATKIEQIKTEKPAAKAAPTAVAPQKTTTTTTSTAKETNEQVIYNFIVRGLNDTITGQDIKEHFDKCGDIKHAAVPFDKITKQSRGFAYMDVRGVETFKAVQALNNSTVKGCKIQVDSKMEPPTYTVFITGLSTATTEKGLEDTLNMHGMFRVDRLFKPNAQNPSCSARVTANTKETFEKLLALNGEKVGDKSEAPIKVVPNRLNYDLFVRGFDPKQSSEELCKYFEENCGKVRRFTVLKNKAGEPFSLAILACQDVTVRNKALALNQTPYKDTIIKVYSGRDKPNNNNTPNNKKKPQFKPGMKRPFINKEKSAGANGTTGPSPKKQKKGPATTAPPAGAVKQQQQQGSPAGGAGKKANKNKNKVKKQQPQKTTA